MHKRFAHKRAKLLRIRFVQRDTNACVKTHYPPLVLCIVLHFSRSFAAPPTTTTREKTRPWTWSKQLIMYLMFYVTNHRQFFFLSIFLCQLFELVKINHCTKLTAWRASISFIKSNSFRNVLFLEIRILFWFGSVWFQ